MNLYALKLFQYTAKYKNITKAAKHFYISQSTLSRNIMSLEKQLDVQLFDRTKKNIQLTPAGEQLYKDGYSLINHIETVTSRVQTVAKTGKGTLRIGLPASLDKNVYDTITEFKTQNPDIDILIEIYNLDELTSTIFHDVYNVAFTYNFAIEPNDDLDFKEVSKDNFSIILPRTFCDNPSFETIPSLVNSLPLIMPGSVEPPFIKKILKQIENNFAIDKISKVFVNSPESAILKTQFGLGYYIIPTSVYDLNVNSNYVKKIDLDNFDVKASIIMVSKKEVVDEVTKKFIAFINQNLNNTI